MTPEQSFKFRSLLSNALNAKATGESDERQLAHEDHLRNFVEDLLTEMATHRATSIKIIEVSNDDSWLAGFIIGREPHCDTFWRTKFPDGISQSIDSLPFNESAKASRLGQWTKLIDMINAGLNEGYRAVRLVENLSLD